MTLTPEEKDNLLELLRKMTPGHVSTLVASLNEPDSRIGTSTESANHAFLQRLCERGLAREVPLEIDMPPEMQSLLTSFLIDEAAKAEIAQLLESAFPDNESDA